MTSLPRLQVMTVAGMPNSRALLGVRASFEPRHGRGPGKLARRSYARPAKVGRRLENQAAGTSQRYDLTHCHRGQAPYRLALILN
jgi:hypothetical protein